MLQVYEPTGRRFKLGPYSLDAWMGWSLSIGHKPTTGISFWNINFKGNRIVYELSLQVRMLRVFVYVYFILYFTFWLQGICNRVYMHVHIIIVWNINFKGNRIVYELSLQVCGLACHAFESAPAKCF
jgi:hypothetical protein